MEEERVRDAASVEFGELPELTRGLRALGSVRQGGPSQTLFFGPLLDARRRAAGARSAPARVRAFNARDLATALERAVERIVADWPDDRGAARRALRAELTHRLDPYAQALRLLGDRAAPLLDASAADAADVHAWRAWTTQLSNVFSAADRCWMTIRTVVETLPRPGAGRRDTGPGKGPARQ